MNFLPFLFIAILLGGEKLSSLKEFLSHVDFKSFTPVLKILGVSDSTIDFLCSEKLSSLLTQNTDLKTLLPLLISLFNNKKEEENTPTDEEEKVVNLDDAISPIKKVAPTEVEETFNAYFS
ncbi:MAG: hypothetical protein E7360_00760 [Clostridiales bacterium]|nr:hypothetical protein [Clostridiales bacterium]